MDILNTTKMNREQITKLILIDLQKGKQIMVEDARKYGSSQTGMPRRIKDLKQKGHKIKIDKVFKKKRGGVKVKYSVYYLEL